MTTSMESFDLTGIDARSAEDIVSHVVRSLTETKIQRKKLDDELSVWKGRVLLAEEKAMGDLAAQARQKVAEVESRRDAVRAEEQELTQTVKDISRQLMSIRNQVERSIDAEALLADLDLLVGERDELAEQLRKEEAEVLLENLKKEMQEESEP